MPAPSTQELVICRAAVHGTGDPSCDKWRTPIKTSSPSVSPSTHNDGVLILRHYIYIHNKFILITFYLSPVQSVPPVSTTWVRRSPPSLTSLLPLPPLSGDLVSSLLHIASLIGLHLQTVLINGDSVWSEWKIKHAIGEGERLIYVEKTDIPIKPTQQSKLISHFRKNKNWLFIYLFIYLFI